MRAWLRQQARRSTDTSPDRDHQDSTRSSNLALTLDNLLSLRHRTPHLSTQAPESLGPWMGPFRGHRHGQGLDFDDLRPYVAGDDVRHIDWKVTARTQTLHTRLYREEKEHVLTCLVDFRSPMFTGSGPLRAVSAGQLAARLIWQAADAGHRVGVAIIMPDGHIDALPAGNGESMALQACGLLADRFHVARDERHANNTTLDPLVDWCINGGRSLGSLLLVSGMDDISTSADGTRARLALWRTARPLAFIQVRDPLEYQGLPNGRYAFNRRRHNTTRRVTADVVSLGASDRKRLLQHLAEQQRILLDTCQQSGINVLDNTVQPITLELVLQQLEAGHD